MSNTSPVACLALTISLCLLQLSLSVNASDPPGTVVKHYEVRSGIWTARKGDTLVRIARHLGVPLDGLAAANPLIDANATLFQGTVLRVPDSPLPPARLHDGLVINLPELRVYRFSSGTLVDVYPIGIGKAGADTPVANTTITRVDTAPTWHPPVSIRDEYLAEGLALPAVVPAGPANPLGTHALRLDLPGYLLHGTNSPDGVGLRVSHGCIRLYNEHAEALAKVVMPGSKVRIINQPLKWVLNDDSLWLEAYRPLTGNVYEGMQPLRDQLAELRAALSRNSLSVTAFDEWLAARLTDGELFSGLVLQLPIAALR